MTDSPTHFAALHDQAMSLAAEGLAAQERGDGDQAQLCFRRAWQLEQQVAMDLLVDGTEPARAVTFRSAASLALLCGEAQDAVRLAHLGLGGHPYPGHAEQLRAILKDAEALS